MTVVNPDYVVVEDSHCGPGGAGPCAVRHPPSDTQEGPAEPGHWLAVVEVVGKASGLLRQDPAIDSGPAGRW